VSSYAPLSRREVLLEGLRVASSGTKPDREVTIITFLRCFLTLFCTRPMTTTSVPVPLFCYNKSHFHYFAPPGNCCMNSPPSQQSPKTRPATQSTFTKLDVNKCPLSARIISVLARAIPLPARAFRAPMHSTCMQVPCLPIGLTVDIMANRREHACCAYWVRACPGTCGGMCASIACLLLSCDRHSAAG